MEVLVEGSWEDIDRFTGLVGWLVCPADPGKGTIGWRHLQSEQTLTSPTVPSKEPELDGLVYGAIYAPGRFFKTIE